jgi:hypothetical protein
MDVDEAGLRRFSLATNTTMGDETVAAVTGFAASGDQTYMTQDDDDAELLQRKPTKAAVATVKPPLKSALKKSVSEAEVKSRAASNTATASVPAKGRITLAEKKKREVSGDAFEGLSCVLNAL